MPNHIATILRIEGTQAQIEAVKNFIKGEDRAIDFNKIIPIPETFRKYDTTNHPAGRGLEVGQPLGWEKDSPIVTGEMLAEYKDATIQQMTEYGCVGWYDWSLRYWGTKWNAYDTEDSGDAILFNTAWSFAYPVVLALSEIFPEVVLSYTYADEDAGYNTGCGQVQGGKVIEETRPDGDSPEAWHLFFLTHEADEEYYEQLPDGRYRYIDE